MASDDDNIANPESGGKISKGEEGQGVPTPDDVRERAEEIAATDDLAPEDVDERELDEAQEELTGGDIAPNDVLTDADALDERDEVPGETGRHVPNMGLSDEQSAGEKLYSEGVDEALRDEMREGGKKLDRENRGLEAGDHGVRD